MCTQASVPKRHLCLQGSVGVGTCTHRHLHAQACVLHTCMQHTRNSSPADAQKCKLARPNRLGTIVKNTQTRLASCTCQTSGSSSNASRGAEAMAVSMLSTRVQGHSRDQHTKACPVLRSVTPARSRTWPACLLPASSVKSMYRPASNCAGSSLACIIGGTGKHGACCLCRLCRAPCTEEIC